MAGSKMIQQCLFMTSADEAEFAGALMKARPSIRFINMQEQPDAERPGYRTRIDAYEGVHVTIVDSSIISEEDFHNRYVKRHPSGKAWIYALVGSGLVSLLRSRAADFLPDSLLNGELRASIPAGDENTEAFVATVLREAKARAEKLVTIDAATGQRGTRVDRKFIAGWRERGIPGQWRARIVCSEERQCRVVLVCDAVARLSNAPRACKRRARVVRRALQGEADELRHEVGRSVGFRKSGESAGATAALFFRGRRKYLISTPKLTLDRGDNLGM